MWNFFKIFQKPNDGDGNYAYNYETSNGIVAYENGQGGVSANGGYRWQSPEGSPFEITYVANEDGFQPQGDHIKQIADNVAKLIAFLKANPSDDDGSYKPSKY